MELPRPSDNTNLWTPSGIIIGGLVHNAIGAPVEAIIAAIWHEIVEMITTSAEAMLNKLLGDIVHIKNAVVCHL